MKTPLLLVLAGLLLWLFWPEPTPMRAPLASKQASCEQPIGWRLDNIDPAFGLSAEQALPLITDAAAQWNQALGTEVLRYDAQQGFPIRFIFDARQQQQLEQLMLQRNLHRYDDRIADQQQDFERQLAEFQQNKSAFEQKDQVLAADISLFNEKAQQADPGAAAMLGREQAELLSRQKEHALEAEQLDALSERLQDRQKQLNNTIADRNALIPAQQASGLAEVGLLEQRGASRAMTIFAYKDAHHLTLTLLHEFGHALGLDHLPDSTSIMHSQLSSAQQELTAADITAWQHLCRAQ
ncbi:MAG: matrixin family metalloprotease [Rheinheimera sp.]|nr:matrixin family metalloprotease [Rheinheimera sp.]